MAMSNINPVVVARLVRALKRASGVNGCCKLSDNLLSVNASDKYKTAVFMCRACGRKHRYMIAETGEFGIGGPASHD